VVVVDGTAFALNRNNISYHFHVDDNTGNLWLNYFGGSITRPIPTDRGFEINRRAGLLDRVRREFPNQGQGDFRIPAIQIRQSEGYTMSALQYQSHTVVKGKPALYGLPATFGIKQDVTTIVIHLYDGYSAVVVDLTYSMFPKYNAIVRNVRVTNKGQGNVTIEALASLSVDFPCKELEMVCLQGDWAREAYHQR
jgi:alpha-galactosidase